MTGCRPRLERRRVAELRCLAPAFGFHEVLTLRPGAPDPCRRAEVGQRSHGSIGHELQHAMEVLSHRPVRNYSAMMPCAVNCSKAHANDGATATRNDDLSQGGDCRRPATHERLQVVP